MSRREGVLKPLFDQLLAECNQAPLGFGWHAGINLALAIPPRSEIVIGALHGGSNLDIISRAVVMNRFGMGAYRVGLFILPEPEAGSGSPIISIGKS